MRVLILCVLLSGCASAPVIVTTPAACSSLLPDDWKKGVPGAPLPEGNTVADWVSFGDAQTGQLDKSNDRYVAGVGIIERCEARDRQAIKQARPKFLGIF